MSKAITKQETKSLAIPEESCGGGLEDFGSEDLQVPRLSLLQALSEAVSDGNAKAGQFQDSLSGEILGDSVQVVPLRINKGAVYFELGKGLKCRSANGATSVNGDRCTECPFGEYHSRPYQEGHAPKCKPTIDFVVVTQATIDGTETRPLIVSFKSSSYGAGKNLASRIKYFNPNKIFAKAYTLGSTKESNDKGTFYSMAINGSSVLDAAQSAAAYGWYQTFSNASVKVVGDEEVKPVEVYDDV